MQAVEVKLISSLEKVFPEDELTAFEYTSGSMLRNEIYSFQLAARCRQGNIEAHIEILSPLSEFINVYTVGCVPSELPAFEWKDDDYNKTTPGLFPDVLFRNTSFEFVMVQGQWHALWFEVDGTRGIPAGEHPIRVLLKGKNGEFVASAEYLLEVIDKELPKQTLIHTEWFYTDCISVLHKAEVFSERYWELVEKYIRSAVRYGVNMLLTPVFTPPLDTAPGSERPTVQLVDVTVNNGAYNFDFSRLARWIELSQSCGIQYFEISHLFTQWGARFAPKIMATVDGEYKQLFGWHTDVLNGDEYKAFIIQFLNELTAFLEAEGISSRCWFHVSDEPSLDDLEAYQSAADTMRSVLGDRYKIMDALSDYEFYATGAVKNPIPASNHIDKFLENGVDNLWTYYCCGQAENVSNRFMAMPSHRNRIIGLQLYKFGIVGFLHWGFNYWFHHKTDIALDPFSVTDAGGALPSGDAFLVYPGEDGPVSSIRQLVFNEALQDMRALKLLESLTSREETMALLEGDMDNKLTFSQYPKSGEFIINLRMRVNKRLKEIQA